MLLRARRCFLPMPAPWPLPPPALPKGGRRLSTAAGGGGAGKGARMARATRYSRLAEAARAAGQPLAAFDPVINPAGLGGMAEGAILAAIAEGKLQGLPGEGRRCVEAPHTVTHFGPTPDAAAMRVLAASGVRPDSLERRLHCRDRLADLRAALRRSIATRRACGLPTDSTAMAGVLSDERARRPYGRAFEELNEDIRRYNGAVARDQLVFHRLPLAPAAVLDWAMEVRTAVHDVEKAAAQPPAADKTRS